MKTISLARILILICAFSILTACSEDEPVYTPLRAPASGSVNYTNRTDHPVYKRHKDAPLKILAIGNSFTNNATALMPWFANRLNGDSICVAKLVRDGSSLSMHWSSHSGNSHVYDFYYSDKDQWVETDIDTFDEALTILDWDIIVLQQVSYLAGDYDSFQPYLQFMLRLFNELNPDIKTAWNYPWAYKPGTDHKGFGNYGNDPEKMYEAIISAGDRAAVYVDCTIPSATLIKRMREDYPEVEDGFSTDGVHISSGFASYALSSLWYECLVRPRLGTTSLNPPIYPQGVTSELTERADKIIRDLTTR